MAYREIPAESVEIQTGLWLYTYSRVIGGVERTFRQLFSSEGYCFWKVNQPENYDEDGNLVPEEERVYFTWSSCVYTTVEEINANYISVPVQDGFGIVSTPNSSVTA
jgi:hypothetical protein